MKSSTIRFLKGKIWPDKEVPIKDITIRGQERVIHFKGGETLAVSRQRLVNAFHKIMARHQKHQMRETIKVLPDKRVSMMIGGLQRGKQKIYVSKKAAEQALDRWYGK
jgi:hypothetical protein